MKKIFTTLLLIAFATTAVAQQTISLDKSGQSSVTADNGDLTINLAGMNFRLGGRDSVATQSSKSSKAYFRFGGVNIPSYNHLALLEIGTNFVVNTNFTGYDTAMQEVLGFSNHKAVCVNINLMTMNVPLNPKRTLGFTLGFGFAMENYTFNKNVSLSYDQGRFNIINLDEGIKKSKLAVSYIHMPMLFDWNIRQRFFISAGASLDILMNSQLSYKKPKTQIDRALPLNPIQVGVTARIGWRRIYAFVNYSVLNMYKQSTDISANRISAGMGLWF